MNWTVEEEKILIENYNEPYEILMNLLPKRTKKSITHKIIKLELPRSKKEFVRIDLDEILQMYDSSELVIYKTPFDNRRDIICLKKSNSYINTDCHIVLSYAKDKDGYAEMTFNNNRGKIRIHRYIYEIYKSKIDEGNLVRHMCHNPSCCNPEHLEQGTQKENSMDMVLANRQHDQRGSKNATSKLSEAEVIEIKKLYKNGVRVKELVEKFGFNRSTINNIVHEYQWTHVQV